MIEWIVSSTVLMIVVLVLRGALRSRLSARFQYALWLLVLVRLLVPVSFGESSLSIENRVEEVPMVRAAQTVRGVKNDLEYGHTHGNVYTMTGLMAEDPKLVAEDVTEEEFHQMETALSIREWLMPLWRWGVVVMAIVFFCSNRRLKDRLGRSRRPLTAIECSLPVYVTEAVETPCLFGLLHPAIYVTPEAAEDEQTLRHVCAHEQTHFHHGDHFWALCRCICLCLHWYHPLVWVCAVLSRRDGELACDEGTLRRIGEGERLDYGRTLIRLTCAGRGSLFTAATTMTDSKKSITARVKRIAKRQRTAVYAVVIALIAATVTAGCTFTGAQTKDDPVTPPAASSAVSSDAVLIGEGSITTPVVLSDVLIHSDGGTAAPYSMEVTEADYSQEDAGLACTAVYDQLPVVCLDRDFAVRYLGEAHFADIRVFYPDGTPVHPREEAWNYYGQTEVFWLEPGDYICAFSWAQTETGMLWYAFHLEVDKSWGEYAPMTPDQMGNIVSAELWSGGQCVTVDYDEATAYLQKAFSAAEKIGATGCPYGSILYLTLADGSVLTCAPAEDSCAVVMADGVYYDYSSADNTDFWNLFRSGLDDYRFASENARSLTEAEIAQVNAAFALLVAGESGELETNPLCGFLASDYDIVNELNLTEFMRYFPGGTTDITDEEFEALKEHTFWTFKSAQTKEDMPVPIHKYTSAQIEDTLWKYAGIGLNNLTGAKESSGLLYLEAYDAWYNFTSDFGPAMFVCEGGELADGYVRLRSAVQSYDNTYQELILEYTASGWFISAHRTRSAG